MLNVNSALSLKKNMTLQSIDGWGGQLDIKRDPIRSVMTRKIVKVGQDSTLENLIGNSGDRLKDTISRYPRGINIMNSMQINNYNSTTPGGSATQASLANKIMDQGSFRPPIIPLKDQLPLSRQNRLNTCGVTNPMIQDYSKVSRGTVSKAQTKHVKDLIAVENVDSRMMLRHHQGGSSEIQKPINIEQHINKHVKPIPVTTSIKNIKYFIAPIDSTNFIKSPTRCGNVTTKATLNTTHADHKSNRNQPDLQRTVPTYSATTNSSGTNFDRSEWGDKLELTRVIPRHAQITNKSGVNFDRSEWGDTVELNKTIPTASIKTNLIGNKFDRSEWGTHVDTKSVLTTGLIRPNQTKIGEVNKNCGTTVNLRYKISPIDAGSRLITKPMLCKSNQIIKLKK